MRLTYIAIVVNSAVMDLILIHFVFVVANLRRGSILILSKIPENLIEDF